MISGPLEVLRVILLEIRFGIDLRINVFKVGLVVDLVKIRVCPAAMVLVNLLVLLLIVAGEIG